MKTKPDVKENGPNCWTIPPLKEGDHKYDRGHLLIYGGAVMTGAPRLAALAAQRAGVGVVTLAVAETAWEIYAISMMSVIVRKVSTAKDWQWVIKNRKITAILIGPGAEPQEIAPLMQAAFESKLPLILDAGALELLSHKPALLKKLKHTDSVLLPHEGEYKRLATALKLKASVAKLERAKQLAKATGSTVLLKGPETFIVNPKGEGLRNYQKAPWLAVAGSGDVLAGIIGALAAQHMPLREAAAAGAWLHGKAAKHFGRGMIPEDLISEIPKVIQKLTR